MQIFLLYNTVTIGAGSGKEDIPSSCSYQVTVRGTGPVSATVIIEATNDGEEYLPLGTITLSGTDRASDGFASNANWHKVRARVTALTGTDARLSAVAGG